jgi:hypothetical protein
MDKFPEIYEQRKTNRYCRSYFDNDDDKQKTFWKRSINRYHAVNFSLEGVDEIPTIEIRFYGGSYATIAGLYRAIQEVVKIIGKYTKKKFEIKNNIETEVVDGCRFIPLEIAPARKINSIEVKPLRFYSEKVKKVISYKFRSFNPSKVKSFDYRFKKPEQIAPIVINYQSLGY